MSEKTIGVLGQKYEDRKTKKGGTVYLKDDENKRLQMLGDNGEMFFVSYASFKSNWRKVKESKVEVNKEETESEIQVFNNDLSSFNIDFSDNTATVSDNDIVVAKVIENESFCEIESIPDVYIRATWGDIVPTNSLKFTRHSEVPTSLKFIAYETMETVLKYIKTAIKNTNTALYKETA